MAAIISVRTGNVMGSAWVRRLRCGVAAVAVLCGGWLGAGAARATSCGGEVLGEGRIVAVVNARSFRLDDGREVRLLGIEPARDGDGVAALSAIAAGRDVILRGDSDAPDRYGRQPAFADLASGEGTIQAALLLRGAALVGGEFASADCRRQLLAAETAARRQKTGLWAQAGVIKNAENPGDILTQTGRFTVVDGKVVSVRQAGATLYLNFGRRWTEGFAVTISRRVLPSFGALGIDAKSFERKHIRVRGWVEKHAGPRIDIRQPGQIELLDLN